MTTVRMFAAHSGGCEIVSCREYGSESAAAAAVVALTHQYPADWLVYDRQLTAVKDGEKLTIAIVPGPPAGLSWGLDEEVLRLARRALAGA
jgi:hypothetical protein